MGEARQRRKTEEQHGGKPQRGAKKAWGLEGNRGARHNGDKKQDQRNGWRFLQVDGERVDAENKHRATNSRPQRRVPLHESVDGERKEANHYGAREAVHAPLGIGGEGILSGLDCLCPFNCAPPQAAVSYEFPSYYKEKTPSLFFQSSFDTDHQLLAAVVVGVQVRLVSIVAVVDERTPQRGQAATCAQSEPETVVFALDLEDAQGAPVDKIGIAVAADAVFAARVGLPAGDVAQSDAREQRMPRRRDAEEIAALLQIPAILQLDLIPDAHKGVPRREPGVRRQALLPPVES